ncbi:dystroglycan 1-like [Saccostrea echinata]|uniref:dystroglycan 1-like n=1 Tax=Saccostrea echinata TaxID=191078 RepID=UPI002A81C7F8|nr:dystroglycan 1-like [Saccostrea echinata]
MNLHVVFIGVFGCVLVIGLSEAEQKTIILTQSKAEIHLTEWIEKDIQQLNYSILLPEGFQTALINSSDPDVTITEDGHIEIKAPHPETQHLIIAIQDLRNSTNPNITQLCPTFYTDINLHITQRKITGLCQDPPTLKKPIDYISLTFGKLFHMKLDPEYFFDAEDGDARQLTVTMTTGYGNPLPSNHWVQYDSTDQVIYGLVLNESAVRNEVLLVVAEDSCGQSTHDAVGVEISGKFNEEYASTKHGFLVHFSDDPICPVKDLKNLYVFVKELKIWFNNSREIFITKRENCSLVLLLAEDRDTLSEDMTAEARTIFDEKGELIKEFSCFFMPGFRITKFEHFMKNHSLLEEDTDIPLIPFKSDINLWFEIVLPVIIILSILLVLIIIVYICCTRKKKLYLLHSEKPTFLEERRPVIFQTEVPVEDPSLCPRNPTILSHYDELPSSEVELIDQRSLPSTPNYTPTSTQPPPAYRVPPPYTNNHQYW